MRFHFILSVLLLAACSSTPIVIQNSASPEKGEVIGEAEGRGCGTLYLIYGPYQFMPFTLNGRLQEAYDNALASVPGATSLKNISIRSEWAWPVIGTRHCIEIKGDAVK